jgi:hypothetical protein
MYKGYKNQLKYKNPDYNKIIQFPSMCKCKKCQQYNPIPYSPAQLNTYFCIHCGTPNYILK